MNDDLRWGRRSLATAVSLALATVWGAEATAAEDDEQEQEEERRVVEEVLVTSFRRSLENSMDLKREASTIVEAVSAEEIGKLPDVSIAESLARLPGLTAQRLNGRGQVISVRGLAPDFTTALLNGRPQVSTGDNRGVEFDQYPSELLSSVVVYKTPDAQLIGQGLAGTADLRTIRPLEYGKQAFAGNLRYERNQFDALNAGSTNDGIRYSASYVDQFRNDTVGFALGFAHMTNPSQEERWNAWNYTGVSGDTIPEGTEAIQGAKPFVRSSDLERDGLMAVLELRPAPNLQTSFDVYASNFNEKQWLRGIELPLNGEGAILTPGTIDNGLVTSGTFEDVVGVVRNDVNERDTQLRAVGWNLEYDLNDKWTTEFDASYSAVDRNDRLLETYSGTGSPDAAVGDTLDFSLTGDQGVVFTSRDIDYTDPNQIVLSSPRGWGDNIIPGGQVGYTNNPTTDDELAHLTMHAERFLNGTFSSVKFGLNFNRRAKSLVANEFFLGLADGSFSAPISNTAGITDLSFLGIPGMISYNPIDALESGQYRLVRNTFSDVIIKSWSVEEDVGIAFAQANLDTTLGRFPLTGNFGMQFVYSDQSSNAFGAGTVDNVVQTVPLEAQRNYKDILPSVNLTLELGENKFVRLGAARTLARPRMDQLRASESFNFDTSKPCADVRNLSDPTIDCDPSDVDDSPWSTTGGNPELDPWVANALDLSYEQYFAERAGYFAIAAFYKDLDSYVFDAETVQDFTGFPTGGVTPATSFGRRTRPENGSGGRVSGFEIAFSMNFDIVAPVLDGFGLVTSASFTDSSIQPNPDDPSEPLPGLSEEVSNITLFYEKYGFSARVSRRHRSEFLGEVSGFGAGRDFFLVRGETIIDAQIGYSFTQGPLAGLSLLLQGNNLTDEPFTTFQSTDARRIRDFQRYGRTYLLGASFKY